MKSTLKLAAVCMCSTTDKNQNLAEAIRWIRRAAEMGADWVLLPEVFSYHGPYDGLFEAAEEEGGELLRELSSLARSLGVCLIAGSIAEKPSAEERASVSDETPIGFRRVYNTSFVFDRQGKMIAKYRKVHLFNLYDRSGQAIYCESDGFLSGDSLESFYLEGFRVGMAICYDLRFPGFFEALARKNPVDILVIPSAFTLQTGMDHWELLLRARAVEQQSYVFAANQFGDHGRGKVSYGHSMIIDPWGYVLANTGAVAGVALAEVNHQRIREVRERLPALKNRRPEIYA